MKVTQHVGKCTHMYFNDLIWGVLGRLPWASLRENRPLEPILMMTKSKALKHLFQEGKASSGDGTDKESSKTKCLVSDGTLEERSGSERGVSSKMKQQQQQQQRF